MMHFLNITIIGNIIILMILGNVADSTDISPCSKEKSRIVRKYFNTHILPLYNPSGTSLPLLPHSCPFHPDRDVFWELESRKYSEHSTKWICQICGKAFYDERYLDRHFDRRHPGLLETKAASICLSDYCDVFRCDIIQYNPQPSYWDRALCPENDLHQKYHRCQDLMRLCLPQSYSESEKEDLLAKMNSTLCHFLTCQDFYNVIKTESSSLKITLYALMSSAIIVGLVLYYLIFCDHYFTVLGEDDRQNFDKYRKSAKNTDRLEFNHKNVRYRIRTNSR